MTRRSLPGRTRRRRGSGSIRRIRAIRRRRRRAPARAVLLRIRGGRQMERRRRERALFAAEIARGAGRGRRVGTRHHQEARATRVEQMAGVGRHGGREDGALCGPGEILIVRRDGREFWRQRDEHDACMHAMREKPPRVLMAWVSLPTVVEGTGGHATACEGPLRPLARSLRVGDCLRVGERFGPMAARGCGMQMASTADGARVQSSTPIDGQFVHCIARVRRCCRRP